MSDQALDLGGDDQREVITQAAFARRMGVSRQAVNKQLGPDGLLPNAVRDGSSLIWPAAREAWNKRRDSRGGKPDRGELPMPPAASSEPADEPAEDETVIDLRAEKLRAEKLRSEKLALELAQMRDELRPKAEVERAFTTIAVQTRQKIDGIIAWAPDLAALTGADVQEVRAFLKAKARLLQADMAKKFQSLDDDEEDEDAIDA